jgi:hypothetical protein
VNHYRRGRGEDGASLVIALAMVTILSVAIVSLLGLSSTSLLSVTAVRSQRTATYSADSAVESAVQTLRYDPSFGGTGGASKVPCPTVTYTAPGSSTVPVSCYIPNDVTDRGPEIPSDTAPPYALWSVGSNASEVGISVGTGQTGGKILYVGGPIASNSTIAVTSVLDATGFTVDCAGSGSLANVLHSGGTCGGSSLTLTDPGYASRSASLPDATNAANYNPAPICNQANATLQYKPGYYTDPTLLQPSTNAGYTRLSATGTGPFQCASGYMYFQSGVYYFDFGFAGESPIWTMGNVVTLGGDLKPTNPAWNPDTGVPPPSLVSVIQDKNNDVSTSTFCKTEQDSTSANGVQFILGGASHIDAGTATVELCAKPSAPGSGQQQITFFGQPSNASNPALTPILRATATPTTPPTGVAWSFTNPPNNLTAVNQIDAVTPPTQYASATVTSSNPNKSTSITLSGFSPTIPSGSVITSVMLRARHMESAITNLTTLQYQVTKGSGGTCTAVAVTPNASWVTNGAGGAGEDVKTGCLDSAAAINGATITYSALHANSGADVTLNLDGIELDVNYTRPGLRGPSGCVTGLIEASGCAVINLSNNLLGWFSWGTTYVPLGHFTVDLKGGANGTGPIELRRGLIARAMDATIVPPGIQRRMFCLGYGSPCRGPYPRVVVLTATVGATTLTARVQYTDLPTLGAGVTVQSWNSVHN